MQEFWQHLIDFLTSDNMFAVIRAIIIFIAGLVIAKLVSTWVTRLATKRFSAHHQIILRRSTYYVVITLFIISALYELGFNLSILVGAAGILSVALGFASQTSASNIISGLFLLGEQPFAIGDVVQVGNTTGEVIAIDLLSVKLRTFDNLYVRIPNETMLKSEVITHTRFPIRRFDLMLGVAYKEDVQRVRDILFDIARHNPLCLEEPAPIFIFKEFASSSQDIQFSVWAKRENLLEMRNSLQIEIKKVFDELGIEIPFPHMTLYTGSETMDFPVKLAAHQDKPDSDTDKNR